MGEESKRFVKNEKVFRFERSKNIKASYNLNAFINC